MEALYRKYATLDTAGSRLLYDVGLPSRVVSGQIDTLLPTHAIWDSVASYQPLSLAPGLMEALLSPSPPSLAFLKGLPKPNGHRQPKQWAIYALVFEKPGCRPHVYVGSGTHAANRVRGRFRDYNSGSGPWSRYTSKAIDDGYSLSSAGLLCWTNLPLPQQVPRQRARFLVLESVLCLNLVASRVGFVDQYFIDEFYLWARELMEWDPLCSHLAINEGVARNIELTEAELVAVAARRVEQDRLKAERYRKRMRDEDEEAFLRKGREWQADWHAKHPGAKKATNAKSAAKAKAEQRFRCPEEDCDYNGGTPSNLKNHLGSAKQKAIVNKDHFCGHCNKAFGTKSALRYHKH